MRKENDRIKVRVEAYFIADIDLERVETDPRWQKMNEKYTSDPEELKSRLFKYLNHYILSGPKLLTDAPFTNGPSDVQPLNMEIVNERDDSPFS